MMMMMLPPLLLLSQAAVPPQPPPKCEGMHCRRSKCGDICTETDCSHFGNVCAGGASAPVGAGWTYESQFEAPDYPPDFTSENATIFYYFNLLARGQFVPQLTLGDGLCNGTGPPRFDCAPCDPNPKTSKQWYMQAQYFWEGHDPGGTSSTLASPHLGRRGARRHHPSSGGGCHVIAGPLIPVHPGEVITTSFHIDKDRIWHASISNGAKSSAIEVPHEYMDKNQTWGETIGLGTCMEVDNLMSRGYYPPSCPPITVTVTAPAGTPTGWQKPWHITEDPTCVFGPSASIVKSVTGELTSTTTIQYAWPDEK